MTFDRYTWILRDAVTEAYQMNIITTSLPNGYLNENYNQTIEARGGTLPYHFSVYAGTLPPDLALDPNTGVISGQFTSVDTFTFTIRCTDSSAPVKIDDQDYTVIVQNSEGVSEDGNVPTDFMLLGNYPNPFNSSTIIRLNLPQAGQIRIDIYNMLGQKIETLYDGFMSAGEKEVVWNGGDVSSGVYFYRVTSGERTATHKMLMLK